MHQTYTLYVNYAFSSYPNWSYSWKWDNHSGFIGLIGSRHPDTPC
jgi:hypothetical protein